MRVTSYRFFPIVTALALSLWLAGCAGESRADAEGADEASHAEEAGEHAAVEGGEHAAAEGGEAREGGEHAAAEAGAHNEGGEAREGGEHNEAVEGGGHAEGGEHGAEGGHDEEGEESGVYIGASETWDGVRNGARLVLNFDSQANAFVGTVENTTEARLCAIRVEVHLSTGTELGPTAQVDLPAGETTTVTLSTEGETFESYTAHPELSPCGGS